MKIAATTLTGNASSLIADALGSVVGWVDLCLVIDTGVTDDTLAIAREVAGEKYVERTLAWTNDFSAARNFALDQAHALGADWAVTVDTDERIEPNGEDLRATLATTRQGVVMLPDAGRAYAKERCFRLPMAERFEGPTHEAFAAYKVGAQVAERAVFRELAKSPEASRQKFERDLAILTPYVQKHPKNPRWHYYLGESLKNLGRDVEAVAAYDACAALRGWDEESAWACYRAAECLCGLERYTDAIDRCAAGLARHAGVAELAWLAGFAAYRLGNAAQAVYWSKLAITHGLFRGDGSKVPRIGFNNRAALYDGPYDVLRFALRALGDTSGADEAERLYRAAAAERGDRGPS